MARCFTSSNRGGRPPVSGRWSGDSLRFLCAVATVLAVAGCGDGGDVRPTNSASGGAVSDGAVTAAGHVGAGGTSSVSGAPDGAPTSGTAEGTGGSSST